MTRPQQTSAITRPQAKAWPQDRGGKSAKAFLATLSPSVVLAIAACIGCQTIGGTPTGPRDLFGQPEIDDGQNSDGQNSGGTGSGGTGSGGPGSGGVVQAGGDTSTWGAVKKETNRVVNFVTGREQEDRNRAKDLYQQGDAEFRRAGEMPKAQAEDVFDNAADLFKRAGEAAPGSALEQDALLMQGESLFFADRLPAAVDVYQRLQKEYPRNKHNDRVAARLFSISRYWIDIEKVNDEKWFTLDVFDKTRPRLDADGHAVRVLDQIRYDDPTGRLADDATMAAAAEHIRQGKFEEADEFLTDLRESFPDSEHLFLAHLLGIRCKMEVYAGPHYSALLLDEAEKLVKQTRQRFPDRLREKEYADMVARASSEIAYHKAEKLFERAQYRDKQKYYGAASGYYQKILDDYADTPFAETARKRLESVSGLPAVPAKRLSWLQNLFPDRRDNKAPLETTFPRDDTMLR